MEPNTIDPDILKYALDDLCSAIGPLRDAIRSPTGTVRGIVFDQLTGEPLEGAPQDLLITALTRWDIGSESANGSVARYPGAFAVTSDVLDAARVLNERKKALEACIKSLDASGITPYKMRTLYSRFGHSRIHPLQAWRQINIVESPGLGSIGFTVAKCLESIEVVTFKEALNRLSHAGADDVIRQLTGLSAAGELRWHRPVPRHIRANLVWGCGEHRSSIMLNASLPFLLAEDSWPDRVRFNQPRHHNKRRDANKTRSTIPLPFRDGAYLSINA